MPPKLIEFFAALCALVLPTQFSVTDSFRAPTCIWCAGNRGIEYATSPRAPVYSAASGEVAFVGSVAGTLYVVVRATHGVLVTHGRLESAQVSVGDRVSAGFRIGVSSGDLYIGVRRHGVYLDPTTCSVSAINPSGLRPRAVLVPIHSHGP
ncbi:MAG: peptidoglycan DD-metalloendopeptidase family protein [Actinomycetes bacterium]